MDVVKILRLMLFAWALSSTGPALSQSAVTGDSLTVYVFLHDECKITQYYTPELNRLSGKYKDQHVGFVGVFPNAAASEDRIRTFGKTYGLSFPMLPDPAQKITRQLGATITPEVAVVAAQTGQLIYRGRIDDSYVRVGKRKLKIQHHDLADILENWQNHLRPDQTIETPAIGCFITFTDAQNQN